MSNIDLVIAFYNQDFSGERLQDAEKLKDFVSKWNWGELVAEGAELFERTRGYSWYESEHAKRFLDQEYTRVHRILDAYVDEGRVYLAELVRLNGLFLKFNPPGMSVRLPPSRRPGIYPDGSGMNDELRARIFSQEYISCPLQNPFRRILKEHGLSQSDLARRISIDNPRKMGRLARGEAFLRMGIARAVASEFGEDAERIQLEYDLARAHFAWCFEPIGQTLALAAWKKAPYGFEEVGILCYQIYSGIAEIWDKTLKLGRCLNCGKLFRHKPQGGGRRKYCNNRCRNHYLYLYRPD